jgi:glycosyltransferase involved in cell wall biosynthesis
LTVRLPIDQRLKVLYSLFVKQTGATAVTISKRMQIEWQEALGSSMPVILNGIDLNHWPMHNRKQDGYLFWYGRITGAKNPIAAIDLAKYLKRPLKIAGQVFDPNYFDQRVKPMLDETIEYVGHKSQTEISQLAANASIFIATASQPQFRPNCAGQVYRSQSIRRTGGI